MHLEPASPPHVTFMRTDEDHMGENRDLKRIGGKLREESRDIVEAKLPERLRVLLERLARIHQCRDLGNGRAAR